MAWLTLAPLRIHGLRNPASYQLHIYRYIYIYIYIYFFSPSMTPCPGYGLCRHAATRPVATQYYYDTGRSAFRQNNGLAGKLHIVYGYISSNPLATLSVAPVSCVWPVVTWLHFPSTEHSLCSWDCIKCYVPLYYRLSSGLVSLVQQDYHTPLKVCPLYGD